jgi:hypothetical protein
MLGSLALHRGVLFVGRHERTAHVGLFDLGSGTAIGGFSFRDELAGASAASGLAVDDDRRLFVADGRASCLRHFTVFGREVGGVGAGPEASARDVPGAIVNPVDVTCRGDSSGGVLVVALGGERRNAVQVLDEGLRFSRSVRAPGRREATFRGVRRIALRGRWLYVAEAGRGAIHVYRDFEYHASHVLGARGGRSEPQAVAPLDDGRMVIACGGERNAILLVDRAGRLLRVLAEEGSELGEVLHPVDLVVAPGACDRTTEIAVLDLDGDRVQLFTLDGRSFGALAERA